MTVKNIYLNIIKMQNRQKNIIQGIEKVFPLSHMFPWGGSMMLLSFCMPFEL
jgi:hypothetical protein